MNIRALLLVFLLCGTTCFSFAQSLTQIKGYAPAYAGQKIELFGIQDYFSMREELLASTTVGADSTFSFSIFNPKIRKVIIRSNHNKGFLYIQPDASYEVYFPERNKFDAYRPQGNDVEISFLSLEENDINYKILSFDKWVNSFLGTYFYRKNINGAEFVGKLDTFKMNVHRAYEKDSANFFLQTYVKFSIASLDDIQYTGARNRFEKFDFYLKDFPVAYDNEAYMSYVSTYYENLLSRVDMEVNNRVYLGVLKSSPSIILNALGNEYTLRPKSSVRLRELVMIKMLSEVFYSGDFPQTNILSVLDSVSRFSLFKENGVVAANMIYRLTELVPGSKAPDFVLKSAANEQKSLASYTKKHLYIQFFDPTIKESVKELELLKPIYEKYKGDVNILTIYEAREDLTKKQKAVVDEIPWDHFAVAADDPVLKAYHVASFPTYVLIDAYGYVVSAPALRPTPNGQYETIEKTFFLINKANGEK